MLSVNPKSRPTISTILEKPFIKKKVASYIYDFMQIYKNDKTLEADEFQCDILKEQAEKLGVFNFIMKEINNFNLVNNNLGNNYGYNYLPSGEDNQNNIHVVGNKFADKFDKNDKNEKFEKNDMNLYTSTEKNKISYLKYLKKKQEEKKKIEEKIVELEKQKKNISYNHKSGKSTNSNSINNNQAKNVRNGSSVEKLKFKDNNFNLNFNNGKNKRPESNKKPTRKISHESERPPTFIEDEGLKLEILNLARINNYDQNENYKSNRVETETEENINKNKPESINEVDLEGDKLMLTQEIERMREQLEKTQIIINKVEKKLTFI
jgi:hypothetical protein